MSTVFFRYYSVQYIMMTTYFRGTSTVRYATLSMSTDDTADEGYENNQGEEEQITNFSSELTSLIEEMLHFGTC